MHLKNSPGVYTDGWGKDVDVRHQLTDKDKPVGRRGYWMSSPSLEPNWNGGLYEDVYFDTLDQNKVYTLKNNSKYEVVVYGSNDNGTTKYKVGNVASGNPAPEIDVRGDQWNTLYYGVADAKTKYNENSSEYSPHGKELSITMFETLSSSKVKRVLFQKNPDLKPFFSHYEDYDKPVNEYTDNLVPNKEYTFRNKSSKYTVLLWAGRTSSDGTQVTWDRIGTAHPKGSGYTETKKFKSTRISGGYEYNYQYLRYGDKNAFYTIGLTEEPYLPKGIEFKGELTYEDIREEPDDGVRDTGKQVQAESRNGESMMVSMKRS